MKKIFVGLEKEKMIILGRQGEKNVAAVIWDISRWVKDYGEGSVTLLYTLEGAENIPYPCQVTVNGGQVEWLITPTELMLGSRGKCQLVYSAGDEIVAKSPVYQTRVQVSLGEKTTDPPACFTGWVDNVLQAGVLAENAAKRAEEAVAQLEDTAQTAQDQIVQASSQAVQTAEEALRQVTQASSQAVQVAKEAIAQLEDTAQTAQQIVQASSQVVQTAEEAVTQLEDTAQAAQNQIVQASSQAVQTVEDAAQEKIEQINEITAQIPSVTEEDNGKVMTVIGGKWTAVEPAVSSWEKVQMIVRAGLAPQYFPVGYEFVTHDGGQNTDIVWVVRGYDTIQAADESLIHTMILETKYVYSDSLGSGIAVQFDAQEALFCVEAGLEPGTYHFTLLSGYDEANGGGGTYSFTLTQFVPSGGVLLFNWQYTLAQNGTISTYTAQTAAEPIETVSVSEGAEGTNLGTDDGSTANMNNTSRARYGSNNYAQSAIRQWLNSAAPAGSVWHPQTKFDRPPNWAGSLAGFMAGLPQDFLAVVQPADVLCRTNNVFEVDSLDGTEFSINQTYILEDKFFILSRPEIYGSYDNELIKDGEQLDFYQNLTDAERIKYSQLGIATNSGMRSPYVDVGDHFRIINSPSGNFGVRVASGIWNCTASCIIG